MIAVKVRSLEDHGSCYRAWIELNFRMREIWALDFVKVLNYSRVLKLIWPIKASAVHRLANRVRQSILVKKALEPAWAFQEQDSPIPNIDLTQRIPMTHSIPLSNHHHWIAQVWIHPDQMSGFGYFLEYFVLLWVLSFFSKNNIVFWSKKMPREGSMGKTKDLDGHSETTARF